MCIQLNAWDKVSKEHFFSTLIFIPASTAFLIIKRTFINIHNDNYLSKLIKHLGTCTFGVMLIESICRKRMAFIISGLKAYLPLFFVGIIHVVISWIYASLIITIIKRIPLIKNYI